MAFRITGTPPHAGEDFMLVESGDLIPVFGKSGAKAIVDAVDRTRPYPYATKVQVLVRNSARFPEWEGMVLILRVEPWSKR